MKCGKKHKDPTGASLEYMKAHKVFEPLASSAYGLCHFYDVGLKATKGSVPISCPMPKAPMMSSQLKALLHKGRRQGHPLLIMAITGEVVMPHGLLSKLHTLGALQHLPMKSEDDPADQPRMKMSFCPFCSYHCCNDLTFLNHIMSFHYNVGYSCCKCVEEVFITSWSFKVHFKECNGLSHDSTVWCLLGTGGCKRMLTFAILVHLNSTLISLLLSIPPLPITGFGMKSAYLGGPCHGLSYNPHGFHCLTPFQCLTHFWLNLGPP